ncbi:MAG: hypothetical protein A2289_16355 [Deltaproteobacteria bacterium RIFOXYA12_FULL_58_15]|nr:MAG: hypothetical protein A2289_16355 [Deltaproteobacteria bacterium RIFOXYA12_FULL_58_15]OGR13654.1 MAG: hypothetical protein A2341_08770 [Deltaproteobacteria bacterium RIFOXYB12_FULL_58_9]
MCTFGDLVRTGKDLPPTTVEPGSDEKPKEDKETVKDEHRFLTPWEAIARTAKQNKPERGAETGLTGTENWTG